MTLVNRAALDTLAAANRPTQIDLISRVADQLATSTAVTHMLIRGSLVCGTSDRLSDVDLVVGINEDQFAQFVAAQDAIITTEFGAIFPGWPDKIVSRMGGLGYVHLIEHEGKLYQLDLYLAPARRISEIKTFARGHLIHGELPADAPEPDPTIDAFVSERLEVWPTCTELLVETFVLAWMIRKRIARGQLFMAYAEAHMITTAARSLIRTALSPENAYYGWYHLDTQLGNSPLGRACLRDLTALVDSPPVPTVDSLARTVDQVLALARRAVPEIVEEMRLPIDAYLHHLDLG